MAKARSSPWSGARSSNPGLRLVLTCPPFRVLQPQPASSASSTKVVRPARAMGRAAERPVYPDPTITTSARVGGATVGKLGRGAASHQYGVLLYPGAKRSFVIVPV